MFTGMEKTQRKEREFNLRRVEILRQAEKVFATKGFYKATVTEIAEASGFAVGTLYQFFEGKEQLFDAMVSEKLEIFYSNINAAVAAKESTAEKISALVEAHFQFVENNFDYCAIFICRESAALAEGHTDLRAKMIAGHLEHIGFIESFLSEGVERGILKGNDPRMMAFALAGMVNSFTFSWMCAPGDGRLTDKVGLLVDIFLQGVKTGAQQS